MARPSQVWKSKLPLFLKEGVAGAAEAMANDDGTYTRPLTVQRLMDHRYYDGGFLTRRTIQYQLRALEALRLLIVRNPGGTRRGDTREYWWNAAALASLDLSVPELRPAWRQKGATEGRNRRAQQKGATDAEIDVMEGRNYGRNRRAQLRAQQTDPLFSSVQSTYVLRTQAPALRAGTPASDEKLDEENAPEIDTPIEGESPLVLPPWEVCTDAKQSTTTNPDLPADRRADPNPTDLPANGRRGHHPAPSGSGLHLQQGPDLPGAQRAPESRAGVGPTQATFGPLDVSAADRRPQWGELLDVFRDALNKSNRPPMRQRKSG